MAARAGREAPSAASTEAPAAADNARCAGPTRGSRQGRIPSAGPPPLFGDERVERFADGENVDALVAAGEAAGPDRGA